MAVLRAYAFLSLPWRERHVLFSLITVFLNCGIKNYGGKNMKKEIMLLDGACGTTLWDLAEKNGIEKVQVWKYNIEHPELVRQLHRSYIAAGCNYIQTNTFSANPPAVRRDSDYTCDEVITAAAKIALEEAAGTGAKVYLSFGPPAVLLEPYGDLEEDEAYDMFYRMTEAGMKAGVGTVAFETFMDIEMMRIAASAAKKLGAEVFCSLTFEGRHRTMMGNTIEQIVRTLEDVGVDAVGMNCSHGPVQALEIIEEYSELTKLPLYYKPNAGVGESYSAEQFAAEVAPALDYVTYLGGCCGTDAEYIRALGKLLK